MSRIQFRFEWSSWIRIHLSIDNSRPGHSPTLQRDKTISLPLQSQLQLQLNPSFKRGNECEFTCNCFPLHWGSTITINQGAQCQSSYSNGHLGIELTFLTLRYERRDGLTERRAMKRVFLRYVVLRSVIAPSVWPHHNWSKPSQSGKSWCFPKRQ